MNVGSGSRSAALHPGALAVVGVVCLALAGARPAADARLTAGTRPLAGGHSEAEATASRSAADPRAEASVAETNVPILLVPGWLDTERDLAALRIRFTAAGWPGSHVEAITFREPTGSNRDHALELDSAVHALLASAVADRVDIVAHSMGGLATRWYLMSHPDAPVRRVAFLATPHRGTVSAHFAWGGGRDEMMPDSPFLDTLNAVAAVPGVEALTLRTRVDTHIVPGESATLPGVVDHLLCCPSHAGLLHDEEAFDIVHRFLLHDEPR